MKLLYLWVEEYGILKDVELNFDSNIRFHYDRENNELKRVESKNEIPENFFSIKNHNKNKVGNVVESVSAIIGNNGAGKTSVFKVINRLLWGGVTKDYVLVFKKNRGVDNEDDENKEKNSFFCFKTKLLNKSEYCCYDEFNIGDVLNFSEKKIRRLGKNNYESELKQDKKGKEGKEDKEDKEGEKPFTLIYFSQFFNSQGYDWDDNNTIDISTTGLIRDDHKKFYNTGTVFSGEVPPQNKIAAHSAMEFMRNINFIKKISEWEEKGRNFDFGFNYPTGVIIKINKDEEAILTYQVKKGLKKIQDCFEEFNGIYKNELLSSETKEKNRVSREFFLFNLSKSIISNYLRGNSSVLKQSFINYWGKLQETLDEERQRNGRSWRSVFNNYFTKMSTPFDVTVKKESGEEKVKYSDNKASMILNIMKILEEVPNDCFNYEGDAITLNFLNKKEFDSEMFILFQKIIKSYYETNTITHYLLFSWSPQISAGEQSYINIFSRFISTFETIYNSEYNNSDFLLFFDEVETTIHPEWQRTLVKNLIKFFEEFFEDDPKKQMENPKYIHLLFASHSPILLSDIPVGNCCLLKREKGSFVTKVVEGEKETAFGSNIYNLYKSSFFLNDGLMGLFAEGKINEVIRTIGKESLSEPEFKDCQQVIDNIGEIVLKNRLQEMLFNKIPKEEKQRRKIKKLEDEIKRLKGEL